jgi:tRNA 2-thiouridine synthesizing protein A
MKLDYRGLRCPQPVLKLTIEARKIPNGTMVQVLADCPDFPSDVRKFCKRTGRVLVACMEIDRGQYQAQVQF